MYFLIEELVSHGYVVVAVNPPYASSFADIDGEMIYGKMILKEVLRSPFADKEQKVWTKDLHFILDLVLKDKLEPLKDRIDHEQIYAMGHSFGGGIAIHLAKESPIIKAAINLDGGLSGKKPIEYLETPCLVLRGGDRLKRFYAINAIEVLQVQNDISKKEAEDFREAHLERYDTLVKNSPNTQMLDLEGINHLGFTDYNFLSESRLFQEIPTGSIPLEEIVGEIRSTVLTFLGRNKV